VFFHLDPVSKYIVVALIIYGTSLHEMGHAFASYWFGDPTPGRHGRLTLNPLPHLEPMFGSTVLPIISTMLGNAPLSFGLCPVDPSRYRRPLRDNALMSLAGPAMNFLFCGLMIGILWIPGVWNAEEPTYNMRILSIAAYWEFMVGCFNLLPIPPLDGYSILRVVLPIQLRQKGDDLRRMGSVSFLLPILIGWPLFNAVAEPLGDFFVQLLPLYYY
jgi:Zn-dependent protease